MTAREIEDAMRWCLRSPHVATREADGAWSARVCDASVVGCVTYAAVAGCATECEALDALARLCGASKHHGDAGVTATTGRVGGGVAWHTRYPTGYALADDALTALRYALGHTRCALANRARLREMHAAAACVCDGDDEAGHAWGCARKWCERVRLSEGVAWRVAGLVREAVER